MTSGDLAARPFRPDPRPSSEGGIGRPKAHARSRARTHRETWAMLHREKGGPCRLCGNVPYELHHVLSKARGGPDAPWNLLALCRDHHRLVTDEDAATLRSLAAALNDEEYSALIEHGGEGIMARLFGVLTDERAEAKP